MVKNGGKLFVTILVVVGIMVWSSVAYIVGTEVLPGKAEEIYDCTVEARVTYSPFKGGPGWSLDKINADCKKSSIISVLSKKPLSVLPASVLYWEDHVIKICIEDACQKTTVDVERTGETRDIVYVFKKTPMGTHTGRVLIHNPEGVLLLEKAFEVEAR